MSQAVSAQNSNLQIGVADTTPTVVTAITKAASGVVTSVAHGLVVGNEVFIENVVGMIEVNERTFTVTVVPSVDTFTIDQNTTAYTTYVSGGTAGLVAWTHVAEVISFSRDGDRAEIDVTSLDSTAKEFRLGLQDYGNFSFEMLQVLTNAGQQLLRTALASADASPFKIDYPDASQDVFMGLVKSFNFSGGVDAVLRATCGVRVTGPIKFTAA